MQITAHDLIDHLAHTGTGADKLNTCRTLVGADAPASELYEAMKDDDRIPAVTVQKALVYLDNARRAEGAAKSKKASKIEPPKEPAVPKKPDQTAASAPAGEEGGKKPAATTESKQPSKSKRGGKRGGKAK